MTSLRRTFALSVALFAVLAPRVTRACAPPFCSPTRYAPPENQTIPGNAPALYFRAATAASGDGDESDVSLVTSLGQAVATTVAVEQASTRDYLVVPQAPLVPGAYVLKVVERCKGGPSTPPETIDHPFTVGASAPLPAALGSVTTERLGVQKITVATASGSCNTEIEAAVVNVLVEPSPALAAHQALARYTLLVDGYEWARSDYGTLATSTDFVQKPRAVGRVFARCGSPDGGQYDDRGLTPGVHSAELRVHVAGATSDPPPVSFNVDVRCEEIVAFDDGGVPGDAMIAGIDYVDEPPRLGDGGCGCELAGGGHGATSTGAALALAGLLLAVRRRSSWSAR